MVFYTWVNWLVNQRSSLLLSTCMLLLLTNLSWHSLDKDMNIECIRNFWVWFLDWKNESWMEVKWRLWKLLSKYVPLSYTLCSQTRGWSCGKLQKGLSTTRANDTKGLKGVILDWITPPGQSLMPPIACNIKIDCGFNHEWMGSLLCPAGLNWSDPEWVFTDLIPLSYRNVRLLIRLQNQSYLEEWWAAGSWGPMANFHLFSLWIWSRGPVERRFSRCTSHISTLHIYWPFTVLTLL